MTKLGAEPHRSGIIRTAGALITTRVSHADTAYRALQISMSSDGNSLAATT